MGGVAAIFSAGGEKITGLYELLRNFLTAVKKYFRANVAGVLKNGSIWLKTGFFGVSGTGVALFFLRIPVRSRYIHVKVMLFVWTGL